MVNQIYSEGWGYYSTLQYYDFSLKNYFLNRAIILIANAFNSYEIEEFDSKGERIYDGPLTKLITEPNYKQTGEELGKEFVRNLFSGGYAYLFPYHENVNLSNFIDRGAELLCLNNDAIDFGGRKMSMFQRDVNFDYKFGNLEKTLNFKQVIPFYDIAQDPANPFKGVSRLKSLEEEMKQIYMANKAIDNQIGLSGNIIVSPDAHKLSEMDAGLDKPIVANTGKTQKQDIEEKLNTSFIFGKSLTVASTALKAINLAESLKDYDYNKQFKQEAGRIMLNLYEIPRKMQNINTSAELKSDKEGEDVDLYEKIVLPLSTSFAKSINSTYSKLTGTTVKLSYDHLSVFQEKRENARKTEAEHKERTKNFIISLYEKDFLSKDEAKKMLQDENIIE